MDEPRHTGRTRNAPGRREQAATRAVFLVAGLAVASWAPLVPLARARIGLDDAQLGGLLLCVGFGSLLAMPVAGGLAGRFGCRRIIAVSGVAVCAALPVMAAATTVPLLAAGLLAFGASLGTLDVVMNIQAVIVEKASGRAMMSGFHGLYSVGGIAGAGAVTGLLSAGLSPVRAVLAVVAACVLLLCWSGQGLLPYGSEETTPAFALPRGRVLLLGALCFVMYLAEGSVLDWSGVLLNTVRGLANRWAGVGYVAFSITMTAGRLWGDAVVRALGPRRVLLGGGLCAAAGFAVAALVPCWPAAVVGFGLVGAGAANLVPVLFSSAGRQKAMPSNLAMAAVSTMAYAGILVGPALIGYGARATSLPAALLVIAAMVAAVGLSARAATPE